MIKIRKGHIIIVGLSRGNINRLLDNQPIVFKLLELGFNTKLTFCITFKNKKGKIALPIGIKSCIGISLNRDDLENLFTKAAVLDFNVFEFKFKLFAVETEEDLKKIATELEFYNTELGVPYPFSEN